MTSLRNLPSVEQILQTQAAAELIAIYGRPLTLDAIRHVLSSVREHHLKNPSATLPDRDGILGQAATTLQGWSSPTLFPLINATGVILHTNLGRAPLSISTLAAMDAVSRGYSNLEYDLKDGRRGSRLVHAETLLQRLTGAESALVVNNNAAAVLLVLSALASRKQVVISRSQLVEIGGGFRIPDVMKQSGAKLVEVGTTNKVHASDYQEAITSSTALLMRAHHSNFKIIGFTEEPNLEELAAIAHAAGIPCLDDLGSGTLLDTAQFGMTHEPTIQESLAAGADIVTFSGDKLLGGPQAGIILGKASWIEKIKRHPLARAMRVDKTRLAGLNATLLLYLKDQAVQEIPVWQMISATPTQVKTRAEAWVLKLGQGLVMESQSTVGGGSLPGEILPTYVLALSVKNPDRFVEKIRHGQPPVIARTEDGRVLLDPRTVLPDQDGALLVNLMNALNRE